MGKGYPRVGLLQFYLDRQNFPFDAQEFLRRFKYSERLERNKE
jgi:hypothetical protein